MVSFVLDSDAALWIIGGAAIVEVVPFTTGSRESGLDIAGEHNTNMDNVIYIVLPRRVTICVEEAL
jgi:hypothetical protein